MSTLPYLRRRRLSGLAATSSFLTALLAAAAPGILSLPAGATQPSTPAAASVLRTLEMTEIERQELRRQLLEHNRSRHGDAAIRRSAAMPEPGDAPSVVADKILPLAPVPGDGSSVTAISPPAPGVPPTLPGASPALAEALEKALPQALPPPVATPHPADAAKLQAPSPPLKTGSAADIAVSPESRLTDRERALLRQQLRQVLRLRKPLAEQ